MLTLKFSLVKQICREETGAGPAAFRSPTAWRIEKIAWFSFPRKQA